MERQHEAYARQVAQFVGERDIAASSTAFGWWQSRSTDAPRRSQWARWAVIVGDDEVAENRVALKWLREESAQESLGFEQLERLSMDLWSPV
ncbi:MAG: hypothetical protein Ct9H300mP8_05150 [Gammaproteobacteria bacterium]|nr:MAG: hypothetical protein Ct9H300mP8_05150 [Gammaproteobacteria bacterium]